MAFSFLGSIRFQLAALLLSLFALLAGASGYALHSAEQRRAEQAVLGEATRLQLAAHLMREQALNYMSTPARDYSTYFPRRETLLPEFSQPHGHSGRGARSWRAIADFA